MTGKNVEMLQESSAASNVSVPPKLLGKSNGACDCLIVDISGRSEQDVFIVGEQSVEEK